MKSKFVFTTVAALSLSTLACFLNVYNLGETETEIAQEGSPKETQNMQATIDSAAQSAAALTEQAQSAVDANVIAATDTPAAAVAQSSITFDIDHAVTSVDSPPTFLLAGCWPPSRHDDGQGFLTLAADGVLTGQCAFKEAEVEGNGSLTGSYDAESGSASFQLSTTHVRTAPEGYQGTLTAVLSFEGSGPVTNGVASGIANFSYSCVADSSDMFCLDFTDSFKTSGSVPFTLTLSP